MAKFNDKKNVNPFQQPWYNPKHAKSQVNGQTQLTQNLIILEAQTRKRS